MRLIYIYIPTHELTLVVLVIEGIDYDNYNSSTLITQGNQVRFTHNVHKHVNRSRIYGIYITFFLIWMKTSVMAYAPKNCSQLHLLGHYAQRNLGSMWIEMMPVVRVLMKAAITRLCLILLLLQKPGINKIPQQFNSWH